MLKQKSSVPRGSENREQVPDFHSLIRPVGPYGSASHELYQKTNKEPPALSLFSGAGTGSRLLLKQKSSVPRGSENREQVPDFHSLIRPVGPYGSSSLNVLEIK